MRRGVSHTFGNAFCFAQREARMKEYFSNAGLQQVSALVAAGTLESGL
jgi:hypothetical protein